LKISKTIYVLDRITGSADKGDSRIEAPCSKLHGTLILKVVFILIVSLILHQAAGISLGPGFNSDFRCNPHEKKLCTFSRP
jgi:hypothetical protein